MHPHEPEPEPGGIKYRPPGWRIPQHEKAGWITTIQLNQDGYCASEALESQRHTRRKSNKVPVPMRRRRVTPRRLWSVLCAVGAFISFARVGTLLLESWSAVKAERNADQRLIDLCMSPHAPTESAHMRGACLKAQRDRASPLLFKAILRSVSTAWNEFAELVGSPFKLGLVVLFLLSGLVMPLMPAVRLAQDAASMVAGEALGLDLDPEDNHDHVVVVRGGAPPALTSAASRLRLPFLRKPAQAEARIRELTEMEGGSLHED